MSTTDDEAREDKANGGAPAEGGKETASTAGEGDVAFAEPEIASEPDPLEVAKAEAQKFREQLLRTAADFENFRKRTRREIEDAQRKGKESAVKELLPVFDNLERAVASAENAPDAKSLAEGLKMVMRQFTTTLEKISIKRVETVGKPFDPTKHEAIQHIESEHEAGVVAAEVQPGYMIGEHLLRAAMVVVSKGPPEKPADDAGTSEPAN